MAFAAEEFRKNGKIIDASEYEKRYLKKGAKQKDA